MSARLLFNQIDIYDYVESQQKQLKLAFSTLSDEDANNEAVSNRLRDQYRMDVPRLKRDKMSYDDHLAGPGTTQSFGQAPHDSTEYVVHVPYEGDASIFEICPSAFNGTVATGEIVNNEVLLRFLVGNYNANIQEQIQRELSNIEWRLDNLRGSNAYMDQQINITLAECKAARRRSVDARLQMSGIKLNLPKRQPMAAPLQIEVPSAIPVELSETSKLRFTSRLDVDVFISHASEDHLYARELADAFEASGIKVWLDALALKWGSPLRECIDDGLKNSRFVIVVLSKAFLGKKKWTEYELSAAFALEEVNTRRILPIWHGIGFDDLRQYSAALTDRLARESSRHTIKQIVEELLELLRTDASARTLTDSDAASVTRTEMKSTEERHVEAPMETQAETGPATTMSFPDVLIQPSNGKLRIDSAEHLSLHIDRYEWANQKGLTFKLDNDRLGAIQDVVITISSAQSFSVRHQAFRDETAFNPAQLVQSGIIHPSCSGPPVWFVRKEPSYPYLLAADDSIHLLAWPENDKSELQTWKFSVRVRCKTFPMNASQSRVEAVRFQAEVVVVWNKLKNEFDIRIA